MSTPLVIIQAREGGTRFPGKIRADIWGSQMLSHVVRRADRVAPVIIAMPRPGDDEDDVLSRFARIAIENPEADPLIRVTADCPMWDAGLGLGLLDRYTRGEYDIVGTAPEFDGLDVEIFSRVALRTADLNAIRSRDREHVTPWMKRYLNYLEIPLRGPALRWSVDDHEGLAFVRQVFQACQPCREGVPHHTNSLTSIGGSDRTPVFDLHQVDTLGNRGGLVECTAYDILMTRTGGDVYVSR